MIDTTIVIPCYNEQARFPVDRFSRFIVERPDVQLLFVDDGSSDGTRTVLESLQNRHPDSVGVLVLPQNAGKAEAVRQGFLRAFDSTTSYVGFWDCDLATPLDMIPRLRQVFAERPNLEMVFGSRVELLGHRIDRHWARYYLGRAFNTVVALMLGLRVHDTQCGAKIFRVTNDLKAIFADPFKTNWVFDVEILARLINLHHAQGVTQPRDVILEHPLPAWHDVAGSKVRPFDFVTAARDLLKIYTRYIRPMRRPVLADIPDPVPARYDYGRSNAWLPETDKATSKSSAPTVPAQRRAA